MQVPVWRPLMLEPVLPHRSSPSRPDGRDLYPPARLSESADLLPRLTPRCLEHPAALLIVTVAGPSELPFAMIAAKPPLVSFRRAQ